MTFVIDPYFARYSDPIGASDTPSQWDPNDGTQRR